MVAHFVDTAGVAARGAGRFFYFGGQQAKARGNGFEHARTQGAKVFIRAGVDAAVVENARAATVVANYEVAAFGPLAREQLVAAPVGVLGGGNAAEAHPETDFGRLEDPTADTS